MTRRVALVVALLLVLLWLPETASAQCAMCRSLLKSPEGQRMIAAFRSGILLLLAAPFAVFATIAVLAVRTQGRRSRSVSEKHEHATRSPLGITRTGS